MPYLLRYIKNKINFSVEQVPPGYQHYSGTALKAEKADFRPCWHNYGNYFHSYLRHLRHQWVRRLRLQFLT